MKKANNSSFWGAMAFLITVASFVVAWKFIIPSYQENQQQSAQLDVDIKYAKAKLNSLNTTKASLSKLGDTVNKILVSIPADKDAPNLISELEVIANTYSVTIPTIQISDAASPTDAASGLATTGTNNKVGVAFTVNGSYDNLSQMISALENDIRFMNITSMSLGKVQTKDGSSSDDMTLTVQLSAYKFLDTSLSTASGSNTTTSSNQTTE